MNFSPFLRRRGFLPRALLVLCLALSAFTFAVAIANILLALAVLAWIPELRRGGPARRREAFGASVTFALAVFVALLAASAVFSLHPGNSLFALKGIFTFLLLPLFADVIETREEMASVANLLGLAALVLAAIGVWQYLHGANRLSDRIEGTLSHYMTYSGLLLLVCLLFLGRTVEDRSVRPAAAAVALALAATLVMTFTRNAYVGFIAASLVFLAIRRPRWIWTAVPAALLAYFLAPGEIRLRMLSTFDPSDPTNRDRLDMAVAGARMVRDYPVFGLGLTLVKPYYPLYRVPDALRFRVPHLHDNVLQIAAESGLFAAAAYVALLVCYFVVCLRRLRSEGDPRLRGLLAGSFLAVAGITVAGLFEYNFGDVEVLMTTLILMSFPFSRVFRRPEPDVPR
ncbi:MAG: O-antigen ligase family protein [Thermoanaerobaculia bacterium]